MTFPHLLLKLLLSGDGRLFRPQISFNINYTIVDDSAQNNDLIAGSQSALSGENGVNQNSTQSNPPTNNANANNNSSANPTTGNASSDTATSTDSPANSTTPDNSTETQPKYSYIEATIEMCTQQDMALYIHLKMP